QRTRRKKTEKKRAVSFFSVFFLRVLCASVVRFFLLSRELQPVHKDQIAGAELATLRLFEGDRDDALVALGSGDEIEGLHDLHVLNLATDRQAVNESPVGLVGELTFLQHFL